MQSHRECHAEDRFSPFRVIAETRSAVAAFRDAPGAVHADHQAVRIWTTVVDLYHFTRWLFGIEVFAAAEQVEPPGPGHA